MKNREKSSTEIMKIACSGTSEYWERICQKAAVQRAKGKATYGHGLELDTAETRQRLDWLEEELIDALMYIEHLKEIIAKGK